TRSVKETNPPHPLPTTPSPALSRSHLHTPPHGIASPPKNFSRSTAAAPHPAGAPPCVPQPAAAPSPVPPPQPCPQASPASRAQARTCTLFGQREVERCVREGAGVPERGVLAGGAGAPRAEGHGFVLSLREGQEVADDFKGVTMSWSTMAEEKTTWRASGRCCRLRFHERHRQLVV
uniref:Uncharacterized protein n=1 Tax=Aegilops tauschii subsp. strangulata TaxID=200361 RepID=A0A452ZME5_AEGTS